METSIFIFIALALAGCIYLINQRNKANKKAELIEKEAFTFEDKMILLQKQANKRLKDIDTTLDYFFWFFVISLFIYFIYAVTSVF